MRAVWITKTGGPDVLEVRQGPDPRPGPGEVRIRVAAAGLNFAEVMARQGLYPDAPKPPCVVGYEVAGVIDALGPGVGGGSEVSAMLPISPVSPAGNRPAWAGPSWSGFAPHAAGEGPGPAGTPATGADPAPDGQFVPRLGGRVVALVKFGGHAEAVCVPADQVLPIPHGMSFEVAAAVPVNYVTAYHMLFRVAGIRPGERILVHAAAGGVGIAALQLCRTVDGVTTFGTASATTHEVLREEGCTHPIDYRNVDYVEEVRRLTDGAGVDVVLDPLGGRDWKKGLSLLRPAGRLIAYGFTNAAGGDRRRMARVAVQASGIPLVTPLGLMSRNQTISGVNIGHLWDEVPMLREELVALLDMWRAGTIRPRIDAVYPFTDAASAHRRLSERQNIGKVLLVPWARRSVAGPALVARHAVDDPA